MIKKILVANRGEIARRIIRTAKKMQINTVALYTNDEQGCIWANEADESYLLGEGVLNDTYLSPIRMITVAKETHCDAIHPGYGFLSENAQFAKLCNKHNIAFIGPEASLIELMGDKITSRNFAQSVGVPTAKSLEGSPDYIFEHIDSIPFPVIIKAAAGGGGKGMQILHSKEGLKSKLQQASTEAEKWFGNGTVYVEQFFENPRHIEVQVLADNFGNAIHLFERECSIQRNYQKIIEEAPASILSAVQREEICNAAIKLVSESGYSNAGTVEFLWDKGKFYFLEMNTRIQVEHTISEEITGVDIVEQQINISNRLPLSLKQKDIQINGHALQARIYAENALKDFKPDAGFIHHISEPNGIGVRLEATYSEPSEVSVNYDGLIAKLIAHGENREQAISKLRHALNNYVIHGVEHNANFLKHLLSTPNFAENKASTQFVAKNIKHFQQSIHQKREDLSKSVVPAAYLAHHFNSNTEDNLWQHKKATSTPVYAELNIDNQTFSSLVSAKNKQIHLIDENKIYEKVELAENKTHLNFVCKQVETTAIITRNTNYIWVQVEGEVFKLKSNLELKYAFVKEKRRDTISNGNFDIKSPLHGKISDVFVNKGDTVRQGQDLLSIESMKTENIITSPATGKVNEILIDINNTIAENQLLITFNN